MGVTIVIGGQYGSEGKGKVSYYLAEKNKTKAVVRVGGSNSGHTIYDAHNSKYAFRVLPDSCILDHVTAVLPAGSYIDVNLLYEEIRIAKLPKDRLKIDPNAVIITHTDRIKESNMDMRAIIGSTLSGTGAAVANRVMRVNEYVTMAKDIIGLREYICDTKEYLRKLLMGDESVIIEGTQGYGLSNYHAKNYPFATSRDTTAAAFLSETGLSPFNVEHIAMVIRTFPIRVAGKSGPLENEIDWGTVTVESGSLCPISESTTVTKKIRRVGRFSEDIVKESILVNRPDMIILNHVDYFDYKNKGNLELSSKQKDAVAEIESRICTKINYCGNGENILIPLH